MPFNQHRFPGTTLIGDSGIVAAATATAEVSDPPRPSVVTLPAGSMPWNPVMMTTLPAARSAFMVRNQPTVRRSFLSIPLRASFRCSWVMLLAPSGPLTYSRYLRRSLRSFMTDWAASARINSCLCASANA